MAQQPQQRLLDEPAEPAPRRWRGRNWSMPAVLDSGRGRRFPWRRRTASVWRRRSRGPRASVTGAWIRSARNRSPPSARKLRLGVAARRGRAPTASRMSVKPSQAAAPFGRGQPCASQGHDRRSRSRNWRSRRTRRPGPEWAMQKSRGWRCVLVRADQREGLDHGRVRRRVLATRCSALIMYWSSTVSVASV